MINCVGGLGFTVWGWFWKLNPESPFIFVLLLLSQGFHSEGLLTLILLSVLGVGVGFWANNSSIVFWGCNGSNPEFFEVGWIIAVDGGIKGTGAFAVTGVDIVWLEVIVTGVGKIKAECQKNKVILQNIEYWLFYNF